MIKDVISLHTINSSIKNYDDDIKSQIFATLTL